MAAFDLKVLVKDYCKTYQSKRNAKTEKDDNHHDFFNFNRELWNYIFSVLSNWFLFLELLSDFYTDL